MSRFKMHALSAGQVLKHAVKDFDDDAMTTYAAALAYRVLFALFPFLIFMVALLGFLDQPQLFDWMRDQAARVLPGQAMDQVNRVIEELQRPRGGLLSVGIALALWSASTGVLSLMEALNVAYDVAERRPAWKRIPLAVLYTAGLAALLISAAGLMVLGPRLAGWLAQRAGIEQVFVTIWTWLRWPVAVVLLMLAVSLVYYVAPNVQHRFRLVSPGAILSVAMWIAASVAFGYYVQGFADYSATYGSLGAVVILLFYFYLSAVVLLFGAEINATIEQGARRSPPTPGPRRTVPVENPEGFAAR